MMNLTAEQKLLAARTSLMWDHPFFGSLAVQLVLVEENTFDTMATDGVHLFWNRKFVMELTKPQLIFVLAHEVFHNALDHHTRKGHRNHDKWNRACDYAINGELVECKVGKMPTCGLIDKDFTGRGAEEIYALLPDEPSNGGGGGKGDPGGCGAVLPAAAAHEAEKLAQASADMKVKVRQAAAIAAKAANGIGNLPGSMQKLMSKLLEPVVDWREVLRRFIDDSQTSDYSWMRPNRRHIGSGFILPGLITDGINHLVVAVDSSGSTYVGNVLQRFASEIAGAFGDGSIDKITVIYADAAVARVDEFERGDEIVFNIAGGGGTAFSDTFRWIAKNAPDASAIIYFTDLEVRDFGEQPAAPLMWAAYGDSRKFKELSGKTPFGEAISLAS